MPGCLAFGISLRYSSRILALTAKMRRSFLKAFRNKVYFSFQDTRSTLDVTKYYTNRETVSVKTPGCLQISAQYQSPMIQYLVEVCTEFTRSFFEDSRFKMSKIM